MHILCSDEEDEDLLEEEETIDELVGESEVANNSTSDQPPAVLEGDQEDESKETDVQKSERWLWLCTCCCNRSYINLLLFILVLRQLHHQRVVYQLLSQQQKEM